MSPFLDSIATIVGVFQQHARGDGDGSGLSRRRMRELIQREFADSLVKPHDPQTIEKILQFLEWDGDGDIDFNEFLLLVFRVAKCCFWFQPRAPFLVQRTKLPTGVKSLREPEFRSRGSCRQLQEEEEEEEQRQTWERDCEVELQRDLRVGEGEISEERSRDQRECRTRNRKDTEPSRERFWEEDPADVRTGRQRREPQPQPDRWSRQELGRDERSQRPRGADGGGDNRPREDELLREERNRNRRGELEQRGLEGRSCRAAELECPESRRPHQSYVEEPLEIDLGECGRAELQEGGYGRRTRQERELELAERGRDIREEQEREERDDPRRKRRIRERRVDEERDLELEVSESRKQEREEEVAAISLRETRDRREICEIEADGKRQRETLRYERERETSVAAAEADVKRETSVAAAEADVKVRREIRERGPRDELRRRERPCEGEEGREAERRISQVRATEEAVRERRIDQERELEVSERRSRQTCQREAEVTTSDQREAREAIRLEVLEEEDEEELEQGR
ncbi:TRHY protein, partial [Copsychus sechellarum]|nr:TRHY protein [Copsychus sechellarum]